MYLYIESETWLFSTAPIVYGTLHKFLKLLLASFFPEVLDTLKIISSNTSFNDLSQRISVTLEPELNKLFIKTIDLNNLSELKETLKK